MIRPEVSPRGLYECAKQFWVNKVWVRGWSRSPFAEAPTLTGQQAERFTGTIAVAPFFLGVQAQQGLPYLRGFGGIYAGQLGVYL